MIRAREGKIVYICTGNFGVNIARLLTRKTVPDKHTRILVLDSAADKLRDLEECPVAKRKNWVGSSRPCEILLLGQGESDDHEAADWGEGSGMDPEKGKELFKTSMPAILKRLGEWGGPREIFCVNLVAGLGGGTGTASHVLFRELKAQGYFAVAHVTMPMVFEMRTAKAEAALGEFFRIGPTHVYQNQAMVGLRSQWGEKFKNWTPFMEKVNEQILLPTLLILKNDMVGKENIWHADPNDRRTVYRQGHRPYQHRLELGEELKSDQAIETFARSLVSDPFQDGKDITEHAEAFIFTASDTFPQEQIVKIVSKITGVDPDTPGAKGRFDKTGHFKLAIKPAKQNELWMSVLAVAKHPQELSAERNVELPRKEEVTTKPALPELGKVDQPLPVLTREGFRTLTVPVWLAQEYMRAKNGDSGKITEVKKEIRRRFGVEALFPGFEDSGNGHHAIDPSLVH